MQTNVIHTSRGPKTPGEARLLFVGGALNNGDLLGIISGLAAIKNTGGEAYEVARYVLTRKDQYRDNIVAKAREILGLSEAAPAAKTGPQRVEGQKHLEQLVQDVKPGMQLRMRFKQNGFAGLTYLSGMEMGGVIEISNDKRILMQVANQTRDWGNSDQNRTLTVRVAHSFKPTWFSQRLYREIETIEILPAVG
ncbi:MAG TPA: hypothetical protein VHD55_02525 [Candidatus Paceibacterota bacterium]|nr:hypothetical protein [Candidatus Paceibacterota bacterium]